MLLDSTVHMSRQIRLDLGKIRSNAEAAVSCNRLVTGRRAFVSGIEARQEDQRKIVRDVVIAKGVHRIGEISTRRSWQICNSAHRIVLSDPPEIALKRLLLSERDRSKIQSVECIWLEVCDFASFAQLSLRRGNFGMSRHQLQHISYLLPSLTPGRRHALESWHLD